MENEDLNILNSRMNEVAKKEQEEFVEDMSEAISDALKNGKVIDLSSITKDSIAKGIEEAIERGKLYELANNRKAKLFYEKYNIHPKLCKNIPCKDCEDYYCTADGISPVECMYRMVTNPPNDLDYDEEYVPSHKEALDMLELHGLLKGDREEYLKASVYYGKAKNYTERNSTEVKGISMSQLGFCSKSAIESYINCLRNYDGVDISNQVDTDAIVQNIEINVEKAMGIYPNIRGLE